MYASPTPCAVTRPVAETVAMLRGALFQVAGRVPPGRRASASISRLEPTVSVATAGETRTPPAAITLTVMVSATLSQIPTMRVVPGPRAVISPRSLTVATDGRSLL